MGSNLIKIGKKQHRYIYSCGCCCRNKVRPMDF